MGFHLFRSGRFGGDAVFGNVGFSGPGDGIEDELTEVVVGPILVEVAAREAEAAMAIGPFVGPGDMLGLATGDGGADLGVTAVGAVFALEGSRAGQVGQNGGDALKVFPKAHVVIPFVVDREGMNATGDWMVGEVFEVGRPVGIDRPMGLEIAANPFEEMIPGRLSGDFDGVMDADQTDAAFDDLTELLEMPIGIMAIAAVAVKDNGVGIVKGGGVFGPAGVSVN